jgi:hypothetical protein
VENRFGDELKNRFGIEPAALTGPEAAYLAGFKDADQLRKALASAERERDRRLRAKGVLPPAPKGGRLDATREPEAHRQGSLGMDARLLPGDARCRLGDGETAL